MDYLNEHGQVLQDPEPINNDCLVFGALHCLTGIGGWALAVRCPSILLYRSSPDSCLIVAMSVIATASRVILSWMH